ncbi:MAG: hypothetical protein L0H25_10205 [Micrococcales bacterium]|nr:hypothetical protein [Micrococcales bacterium]
MAAYDQQQRFDRMRAARRMVRALTISALVAHAVITLLVGRSTGSGSGLVRVLIGGALLAWGVAFVCDYRVHSNRLNSRMIMMRLRSVEASLDELQRLGGPDQGRSGRPGASS